MKMGSTKRIKKLLTNWKIYMPAPTSDDETETVSVSDDASIYSVAASEDYRCMTALFEDWAGDNEMSLLDPLTPRELREIEDKFREYVEVECPGLADDVKTDMQIFTETIQRAIDDAGTQELLNGAWEMK